MQEWKGWVDWDLMEQRRQRNQPKEAQSRWLRAF